MFFALNIGGRPAFALDEDDLRQLAKFSSQEYFLAAKCNLAPSEAHTEKFAENYVDLNEARRHGNEISYTIWREEVDRLSMEYALLSFRLPAEEFCERLKSDYVSAGGEFVDTSGRKK